MENYTQQQTEFIHAGNVNTIPIYRSKRKVRGLIVRSILVIVLVIFAVAVGYTQDHSTDKVTGLIGGVFCIDVAILVLFSVGPKLKQKEPAIILDEKGIIWRMNGNEPVRIFWENVVSIETASYKAMNFLVVKVNNGYQLKEGKKGLQSFFMGANEFIFGSPICFRASTLEFKLNKLSTVFIEARNKYTRKK